MEEAIVVTGKCLHQVTARTEKASSHFLSFLRTSNTSMRRKMTISRQQHQLLLCSTGALMLKEIKSCVIFQQPNLLKGQGKSQLKIVRPCLFRTGHWLKNEDYVFQKCLKLSWFLTGCSACHFGGAGIILMLFFSYLNFVFKIFLSLKKLLKF